jgi:hypothetical protein
LSNLLPPTSLTWWAELNSNKAKEVKDNKLEDKVVSATNLDHLKSKLKLVECTTSWTVKPTNYLSTKTVFSTKIMVKWNKSLLKVKHIMLITKTIRS